MLSRQTLLPTKTLRQKYRTQFTYLLPDLLSNALLGLWQLSFIIFIAISQAYLYVISLTPSLLCCTLCGEWNEVGTYSTVMETQAREKDSRIEHTLLLLSKNI